MSRFPRLPIMLVAAFAVAPGAARGQLNSRVVVLRNVNSALAVASSGRFTEARANLEGQLARCGAGPDGRDCRILSASGLGAVLQQQGSIDRKNRDSLYTASVVYYDRVLREAPADADAVYGKALAYRSLGPHEWMEPFFRQAPSLDTNRAALYLTFQGDYFAATKRFPQAVTAYRAALRQNVENDGARGGLVDALAATGASSSLELVQLARGWEAQYPESALNAYRAVLVNSFAPGNQRDAIADSAMVGLVRVQARNRLAVGSVPRGVSTEWTPVREMRSFLDKAVVNVAPWWRLGPERDATLAQAALAGGRAAAAGGRSTQAESLFAVGVAIAKRTSTTSLDLQRELALLYYQHGDLDPSHRKFDALEQDIFEGKMGALQSGDLEAAQRYHTTLGLIYAGRGVWKSTSPARNAIQQLVWALDKAEERRQRQQFYQPLPELGQLLAHHLDSLGRPGEAAQRYADAARGLLDVDDFTAADAAAKNAMRLGAETSVAGAVRVSSLRSDIALGGDAARSACTAGRMSALLRSGDAAFVARQRFKVLADCAAVEAPVAARGHAIMAFQLVDSARGTLIGGNDVTRFERVMRTLLQPFSVTPQSAHLDPAPAPTGPSIQVWMAGESVPYWYDGSLDDIVAARAVSVIGTAARPFPLTVSAGMIVIPRTAAISPELMSRLKAVRGARGLTLASPPR